MCPSWGGRRGWGSTRQGWTGLHIDGKSRCRGKEDGCFLVSVNVHMHPTPVAQLPVNTAIHRQVSTKVHKASEYIMTKLCVGMIRLWIDTMPGPHNLLAHERKLC